MPPSPSLPLFITLPLSCSVCAVATTGQFPYLSALFYQGYSYCTGTLIHSRVVLTAGAQQQPLGAATVAAPWVGARWLRAARRRGSAWPDCRLQLSPACRRLPWPPGQCGPTPSLPARPPAAHCLRQSNGNAIEPSIIRVGLINTRATAKGAVAGLKRGWKVSSRRGPSLADVKRCLRPPACSPFGRLLEPPHLARAVPATSRPQRVGSSRAHSAARESHPD